jgi:K+-sensing histidine kinase KdpD
VRGVESIATWQTSLHLDPWEREPLLYEEPTLWELFQSNKTGLFPQVAQDPRLTPFIQDLLADGGIQSMLIFPLVALGNWIGVLLVYFQDEHHFDSVELRHLKILVDQATITLYNLELLEVEEDLRHEAERANEIKTQFLAMISHELRTPLTSIIGFTTTLLAEDVAWDPEEEHDFIHTIRQEANRLQELIDHLLDLSRLEAGMLPISSAPVSLRKTFEDALPQIRALTGGQEIVLHLPTNLPPVLVDVKRIIQVLTNLAQNAAVYASTGKQITLSAALRKGYVQVSVADLGPGFRPDERKSAFEAFRRGTQEENHPGKGAGLGLAICKRLIEAQGGRIWIKKQTTPGATICFTVPLAPISVSGVSILGEE